MPKNSSITLCSLFCLASAAVALDRTNAIVELTIDNYYKAANESGAVGCKPCIIKAGPSASRIQPTSGWKGSVNLKVEYGSCTPQDRDYSCMVNWGDGSEIQVLPVNHLLPCQMIWQYPRVNHSYNVHAMYCGPSSSPPHEMTAPACDNYVITIDVSSSDLNMP